MAITVNGREYEWGDISLVFGGVSITGFRAVKYGPKQEKEALHTKGYKPQAIQNGNMDFEGGLKLTQSAADAMDSASNGNLLNIRNANLVVQYGDPFAGTVMTQDVLTGISFTENIKDWTQGQKFLERDLPFLYLDQE